MDNKNNLDIMNREMQKISKDFLKCVENYKNCIEKFSLDVPIQVLCLPENIQNILIRNNLFRVIDLTTRDLTKIKGLGSKKLGIIFFRLNEFFPM